MTPHRLRPLAAALIMTAVMVGGCGGPEGYLAGTAWYAKGSDPREIIVFASVGGCDEIEKIETSQKATSITVRIWAKQAKRCGQLVGADKPVRIRLDQELGTRTVLSHDGNTLQERN